MKVNKKLSILMMLVLAMYCLIPGQAVAASGVKASSFKKVTTITNGTIDYETNSSKYIVFSKHAYNDKTGQTTCTIYYSKDMKKFYTFDFEKMTGYNFKTNLHTDLVSVKYINNKFYFFIGGVTKDITYYETSDFKKFSKRIIKHSIANVDMPNNYDLYKSGSYYYLACDVTDVGDVSLNRTILRSKDMKNWTHVSGFDKFVKKLGGGNDKAIEESAFGDVTKIGKDGNTVLVTVYYADASKVAYYKTNDFTTYTKVTEDKIKSGTSTMKTDFYKLPGENKGIRLVLDKGKSTLTLYTGKDINRSYKKIKTISSVSDYRWSVYNKSSKKHYLTLLVRTKSGKKYRYTSNSTMTSFTRYSSKLKANKLTTLDYISHGAFEIGSSYRGFIEGNSLVVSKAYNHFKSYKWVDKPMKEVSQIGAFKNKMYYVGYSNAGSSYSYGLYTLDTAKLN